MHYKFKKKFLHKQSQEQILEDNDNKNIRSIFNHNVI